MEDAGWGKLRTDLEADVRRVADRLRSLSLAQLAAPVPPHASRASAARDVAQQLAEAAQGLEQRTAAQEPPWRQLPVLEDGAVADQVAVVGHDLLGELDRCRPEDEVWTPATRRTAREVVSAAAEALTTTRRAI